MFFLQILRLQSCFIHKIWSLESRLLNWGWTLWMNKQTFSAGTVSADEKSSGRLQHSQSGYVAWVQSHLGGYNSSCFIPEWETTRFRKNMANQNRITSLGCKCNPKWPSGPSAQSICLQICSKADLLKMLTTAAACAWECVCVSSWFINQDRGSHGTTLVCTRK